MINFDELRLAPGEPLQATTWNGLLDRVKELPLTINPNGNNVGVGNLHPGKKLEATGNIVSRASDSSGGTAVAMAAESAGLGSFWTNNAYNPESPGSGWRRTINMRNGNVGIGTANPSGRLEVSNGTLTISNRGSGKVLLNLATDRSWQFRQLGTGAATALELRNLGGGGNKNFVISTSGNVGIGTPKPASRLSLGTSLGTTKLTLHQTSDGKPNYGMGITAGHFRFHVGNPKAKFAFYDKPGSSAKQVFRIQGDGRAYANGIRVTSDARLKTDIQTLDSSLGKLSLLRGVAYKRTDGEMDGGTKQFGLIAQEVENVFPELVVNGLNGMKSLDYNGLIAVLVEAVKNQQEQIDKLSYRSSGSIWVRIKERLSAWGPRKVAKA